MITFSRMACYVLVLMAVDPVLSAAAKLTAESTIEVRPPDQQTSATAIAIQRLRDYTSATVNLGRSASGDHATTADLLLVLSINAPTSSSIKADTYTIQSSNGSARLMITVTGTNPRSLLYGVYRLADLMRVEADLTNLNLKFSPKIGERFVSFGATTHGRRQYRPDLYWRTLSELPRYGYNGVVIYPGGGTPLGRHSSPLVESDDRRLSLDAENTAAWKNWLAKVEGYGLEIMMTVPPAIPPGYEIREIRDYYAGGPEPKDYLQSLKSNFRRYLELLTEAYPETDLYMFNSTEGATFGRNQRFFGQPAPDKYKAADYLRNNDAVMSAYFDVLTEHFGEDLDKVMFWTHSFGLTSDGIRRMREVLFRYPRVTIIEDDFWNNNLWPLNLPAMAYLPADLRAQVSQKNPFALFQIATDGEYYGGGSLPNAYPDAHIRSAREAIDRDARMVIQRLDLHDRTPYGTAFGTMEIVPLAGSRQLWEPTPSTEEIWAEWASSRFGPRAAPHVVEALQHSDVILQKGLSCNGIDLLGVGSEFLPRLWMKDNSKVTRFYLFGKPGRDFVPDDKSPILSEEYTSYQMDTHSIAISDWRRNQSVAAAAVEEGLIHIELARPHLSLHDYEMLQETFMNGRHVLGAVRLLGEAAYATNLVLDNFDAVESPGALFTKTSTALSKYLDENKLVPEMTVNLRKILQHYEELAASSTETRSRSAPK